VLSLFLSAEAESLVGASLVASECAPEGVGFESLDFLRNMHGDVREQENPAGREPV
jgi:hypothetical protein